MSSNCTLQSGIMFPTEEKDPLGHNRFDCHAPWDPDGNYWAVTCPDGYFLDTLESVALACERSNLYCPADLVCLCRPCIKDMVLLMYPVQARPGHPFNFPPWCRSFRQKSDTEFTFSGLQVVLGLCVCLFVVALFFTLCWRLPLEGAHLVTGRRRSKQVLQHLLLCCLLTNLPIGKLMRSSYCLLAVRDLILLLKCVDPP